MGTIQRGSGEPVFDITKQYMIMVKNKISKTDIIEIAAVDIKGCPMEMIMDKGFKSIDNAGRVIMLGCGVNRMHYIGYIHITNITKGWSAGYSVLGKKLY